MSKTIDLNEFVTWAKESPSRSVKIEINRSTDNIYIWVYDVSKMQGQSVKSVDEIDLCSANRKRELAKYKELKAKFGDI